MIMFQIFKKVFIRIVRLLPPLIRSVYETRYTQTPITLKLIFFQKVLRFNSKAYWPVHFSSVITHPERVYVGIETCPGYMPGCYIQGAGKIYIGDYTQISANVGIISVNHSLYDNRQHVNYNSVVIGKYCWIAMNVMILPGVKLGDFTIVGAGSVVTKSFEEGFCVVAGNPARIIKKLNMKECVFHKSPIEYNGYIKNSDFKEFSEKKLEI
jgi:acetyltransferase-like isoleucine patch superfamily enzyme